jgi:hypothetical protein
MVRAGDDPASTAPSFNWRSGLDVTLGERGVTRRGVVVLGLGPRVVHCRMLAAVPGAVNERAPERLVVVRRPTWAVPGGPVILPTDSERPKLKERRGLAAALGTGGTHSRRTL